MEAIVAVGLAGNVVQFASSAGALIKEANLIRKSGSPSSLPKLKELSESLTSQAAVLRKRLKASSATLTEEDQNLLDLTSECGQAGKEFIAYLNGLMSSSSSTFLRTTKTAIKFQWASHRIDEFVSTLDKLRNSLTLAAVLALRKNNETSNAEVLVHLMDIQRDHESQDVNAARTHTAIELLSNDIQNHTGEALKTIQDQNSACLDEITALRCDIARTREAVGREDEILRWLDFRQILWRYQEVGGAYEATYEWIFQSPHRQNRWADFPLHLQKDNVDPYFINGKAGSGKSTLMKFVQNHKITKSLLGQWAGSKKLAVLHFYFWNLGTPLQKTHVGLLRALLHQTLAQYPELIPAVFPKLYHGKTTLDDNHPPEYIELKEAFDTMIKKSRFLKLAIFIDGIDEFEGDHRDMALFLRSLASSNVKLFLSSRPLNACLSALDGCPSLRLQDLTEPDMKRYVDKKLSSHPLMIMEIQKSPDEASQLTIELTDKADGVFLWVTIVVRLLIEGLENGDNLDELKIKLASLPPDLKSLYRRMFEKLDPQYRKQGLELFRLLHEWWNTQGQLPTLTLSYTLQSSLAILNAHVPITTYKTFEQTIKYMEKRVRSRSCGLLEVRIYEDQCKHPDDQLSIDEVRRSYIKYIHRTAGEFLALDEVWEEVCSVAEGTDFNPALNLASAFLVTMKTTTNTLDGLRNDLSQVVKLCRRVSSLTPQTAYRLAAEIDEIRRAREIDTNSKCPTDIHLHAAQMGLVSYYLSSPFLDHMDQLDENHQQRFFLVKCALDCWFPEGNIYQMIPEERWEALSHLLVNVMGPDNTVFGQRLRIEALTICDSFAQRGSYDSFDTIILILHAFLKASKSPATLWQQLCEDQRYKHFDPSAILESCRTKFTPSVGRFLREVDELIAQKDIVLRPQEAIRGTSKRRRQSKKRKNNDHGSQNKRRR